MSAKRKRVVVSLETKLNAIRRLDNGESIRTVAKDLGVGEVTVGDWRRKRAELEKWGAQSLNSNCNSERKTFKKCEYEKTSEALFLWFSEMRARGSPISGPILQAKALDFHKSFGDGDEPFTASSGWLMRWKNRYGVRQLNISGEKLSGNETDVTVFEEKIRKLILSEGLTSDQIFNCDETGLNFRMLPSKTLASQQETSAPGYKKSKDRVTVLGCANAAGSLKLKPVVIGKYKKPRAFKNTNVDTFPSTYTNQKNAWMDSRIFKQWFFEEFVPVVEAFLENKKLPRKALLILDNASSHPDADELVSDGIRALFLPPNVTALIQPLDQGVLETFKRNYKKRLLRNLLEKLEDGLGVTDALKLITMKDVVYWVSEAWDNVREDTIRRSWRKLFGIEKASRQETAAPENQPRACPPENEELVNLCNHLPVAEPISAEDISEWINGDEDQALTDDVIIQMLNQPEDDDK
uniref:HTH CENPB-type domain-containing protein n=1 Tax=Cuerna arida TaxID=1464854 RepID=A0A1B6GWK2_9HEMI